MATTVQGLSEKQLALRRTGIGASEVAAVVGLHPTKKPIDVWAEKTGRTEPFEGNEFTEWGHRIERVVAEAWQERHPEVSIFTPGTLRHRDERFSMALASPDRVVVPQGRRAREVWQELLEIKNVSTFRSDQFGEEGTDDVPEHMLVQVQYQLEVVDLEKATLVPLIGGNDFRQYPIERDREFGAMLVDAVARFWHDHVEADVPPPVDGSASYSTYLRRRFPAETGPLLDPSPEAEALVKRLRGARAALRAAEADEAEAGNVLRAFLGEAAGVAGLCTWKANKPSEKLDFEAALEGFLVRLEENPLSGGFSIPRAKTRALWDEVRRDFTVTRPGARVLRLSKGE